MDNITSSENDALIVSELTLRSLSSIDFIIKTKAIRELWKGLSMVIATTACGAIIFGRARIGKTRAMMSIADSLCEKYGEDYPVIMWDITDHAITERNFYCSLLMAMDAVNIPKNSTALALKERVLNELTMVAYKTPFKKVVIMLDEAWKLDEKDFSWLMDLYNNLSRKDILLTCFLFGTRELKDFKGFLKANGKDQIIGRFMVNEFEFFGIREAAELRLCLLELDRMNITTPEGVGGISILDFYFPDRGDMSFADLSVDYWDAFTSVRKKQHIMAEDIPMKYFIDSFIVMLQKHGNYGAEKAAFPSFKDIVGCIMDTGFGESDDEYKPGKRSKQHRRY